MKKLTFTISLIALIACLALCISANEIYDVPERTFNDVHVTQYLPHVNESDFYDYIGIDPSIFRVTAIEMISSDNERASVMFISFVNDESGIQALARALQNYKELAYPNISFSQFNDINLYSSNLESFIANFPYNNLDSMRRTFNMLGDYYSQFRFLESEYSALANDYQVLESTLNEKINEIQRLENVVYQQNVQIEKLELDVINSYSQGLEDSEIVQNSFISIATMPFYFLKSIFNFEVFGINFFTIIQVILTLLFVSVVIKIFI